MRQQSYGVDWRFGVGTPLKSAKKQRYIAVLQKKRGHAKYNKIKRGARYKSRSPDYFQPAVNYLMIEMVATGLIPVASFEAVTNRV